MVIRRGKKNNRVVSEVIYHSIESENYYGCPVQIGSNNDAETVIQGAELNVMQVKPGDWILVASDGVFDNILGEDLLRILNKRDNSATEIRNKCLGVVGKVYENTMDPDSDTPYSRATSSELNMLYHGGKDDDTTCILIRIESPSEG